MEGANPFKIPGGKWGKYAVTAGLDVVVNAATAKSSEKEYTVKQGLADFMVGYIGDASGEKLSELISKYGPKAIKYRLKKLDLDDEVINKITRKLNIDDIPKGTGEVNWNSIRATQEAIEGTNVPRSFVIKDLMVNGKEVWVGGNATKHMGEFINSANKAGGGLLSENEIMESFMNAAKLASEKTLKHGDNRLFVGGWEIGINGETGVIYHALMK